MKLHRLLSLCCLAVLPALPLLAQNDSYPGPPLPKTPPHGPSTPVRPPHHAIVLFNGKNLDAWTNLSGEAPGWEVQDGIVTVKPGTGNIMTKEKFGDYRLHVEFKIPLMHGLHSQARGNSGVYQQGLYEVQVLDAYHNPTYQYGECGAVYGQHDPYVNACLPPEQWQSYDIIFRAPRFDASGKKVENARITVYWNGLPAHRSEEITGPTTSSRSVPEAPTGPIMLQDHGCPDSFRDLWIVPLKDATKLLTAFRGR